MLYNDSSYEIDFKICVFQTEMYEITLNRETQSVVKYIHSSI